MEKDDGVKDETPQSYLIKGASVGDLLNVVGACFGASSGLQQVLPLKASNGDADDGSFADSTVSINVLHQKGQMPHPKESKFLLVSQVNTSVAL